MTRYPFAWWKLALDLKVEVLFAACLFCAAMLAAVGCARVAEVGGERDIVIGVIAPLTRGLVYSGPPTVEGATLAADEVNAAGGLVIKGVGRRGRLVVEDDEGRPEIAISKAIKLIEQDVAVALVGLPVSDSAIAVAKVAEEHRVPMISNQSTHPETTRGRRFAFRATFVDTFQGRMMADFAFHDLGARTAALLVDFGSAYSKAFADVFKTVFEGHGGSIAAFEHFAADDSHDSALLRRIRDAGPDVFLLPIYESFIVPLVTRAREVGIESTFLGGDSWTLVQFDAVPQEKPAYFADVWAPDVPGNRSRTFIDAYRRSHGRSPSSVAALTYDSLLMIFEAIEQQQEASPETIRLGLQSLGVFHGVTGSIRYSGTGDPVRSAVIMRVESEGTVHFHKRVEP